MMRSRNLIIAGIIVVVVIGVLVGILLLNSNPNSQNTTPPPAASSSSSSTNLTVTSSSSTKSVSSQTSTSKSSSSTATTRTVNVSLTSYDISPSEIEVKPGETLQLKVTSNSDVHDFIIDELNIATRQLGPGETQTVTVTIPSAATNGKTYEFYCNIGSHKQFGMQGNLKVKS